MILKTQKNKSYPIDKSPLYKNNSVGRIAELLGVSSSKLLSLRNDEKFRVFCKR